MQSKEAKVFCGTWNVNGKELPKEPTQTTTNSTANANDGVSGSKGSLLTSWLFPNGPCISKEERIDIFAIGFQELVDLDVSNVVLSNHATLTGTVYWREKVEECLHENRYRSSNSSPSPNVKNRVINGNGNGNGANSSESSNNKTTSYGDEYVLLAEKSLVGLLLLVYARRSLLASPGGIKDIRTSSVATGLCVLFFSLSLFELISRRLPKEQI